MPKPPNPIHRTLRDKAAQRPVISNVRDQVMRYQGRVAEWNDDRGFGFVQQNGGGSRVFLHISAFGQGNKRPTAGQLITYEVATDPKGRPQARAAAFVEAERSNSTPVSSIPGLLVGAVVVATAAYIGYVRLSHPGSTIQASVYRIVSAREALRENSAFSCQPAKTSCAQMSSCAEALFHQERCGATDMDGDHDGIPCEQQWCN